MFHASPDGGGGGPARRAPAGQTAARRPLPDRQRRPARRGEKRRIEICWGRGCDGANLDCCAADKVLQNEQKCSGGFEAIFIRHIALSYDGGLVDCSSYAAILA